MKMHFDGIQAIIQWLIPPTSPGKIMKSNSPRTSELHPPDNITPSVGTVLSGIMFLLPLGVFLIGLYSGAFKL
jgi:hypothetical protein